MKSGLTSALGSRPGRIRFSRRDSVNVKDITFRANYNGATSTSPIRFTFGTVETGTGGTQHQLNLYANGSYISRWDSGGGFYAPSLNVSYPTITTNIIGLGMTPANSASVSVPVRISPSIVWEGRAWNTTPTAATVSRSIEAYLLPTSGTTTGASLIFANKAVDTGVTATTLFSCTDNGAFSIPGTLDVPSVIIPSTLQQLDIKEGTTGPGTVSVSGTGVTGVSTLFTKTFRVNDTITVQTTSGSESKAITTITSDTVLVTAAFAGTASGVAYSLAGGTRYFLQGDGTWQSGTVGVGYYALKWTSGDGVLTFYRSSTGTAICSINTGSNLLTIGSVTTGTITSTTNTPAKLEFAPTYVTDFRSGANPHKLRVFSTFTARGSGTTSLECLDIHGAAAAPFVIQSMNGSVGGTARDIEIRHGATDTNNVITDGTLVTTFAATGVSIPGTLNVTNTTTASGGIDVYGLSAYNSGTTFSYADAASRNSHLTALGAVPAQFLVDINRQGFVNRTDTTLGFSDGVAPNKTFTLTRVNDWSYYRAGIKYTITVSKSVNLPTTTAGIYYVYIDATDGTLTCSAVNTPWDLSDSKIPVAVINYNSASTPTYWIADERHGVQMDWRDQYYMHHIEGAKAYTLPSITGSYAINTVNDVDKTMGFSASAMMDQDIKHDLALVAEGNGSTTPYVVWYRTGASAWAWKYSTMPFIYNVGNTSNIIQYDNGGTMQNATVGTGGSTRYVNTYVLMTNKIGDARYVIVPGRAQFTSVALAQAEAITTFTWEGFEIDEAIICYRLTWKPTAASNTGTCQLAANPQQVNISTITNVSSGAGTDHNTLANLLGGTYHMTADQYAQVGDSYAMAILFGG